jgi:hypothetical protein
MIRPVLVALALFLFGVEGAHAQGAQCRTVPAGTQTSNCASENTVAESRGTLTPGTFSTLAACSPSNEGTTADVTDSTTNVFGATITGGGSFHVLGYCNGANWTVAGGGILPSSPNPVVKAAVFFTQTGGVVTIVKSFNVASVTRASTGLYTVNFTTPMADANYYVSVTNGDNTGGGIFGSEGGGTKTTTACPVAFFSSNTVVADPNNAAYVLVFE